MSPVDTVTVKGSIVKHSQIKKLLWLGLFLLCLCGCARRRTMSAQQMETLGIARTEAAAEAGLQPDASVFFAPNATPEDAALSPALTEEQLRVVGASYDLTLSCGGQSTVVRVVMTDTTPPTISGAHDLTVSVGDSVSYRSGVEVSDNAEGEVTLEIENSYVDLDKEGDYPVRYIATDAAGNVTEKDVTLLVVKPSDRQEEVDRLADELIAKLVTPDMSKWDTCYALWKWCRDNIKYSYTAGIRTIYAGAYEGLHDRYGDCYAYYATFTLLLQKCGIETMEVRRVGGTSDHWWNLVNLGDGWYHCDSSPRRVGDTFECFMQTDAQVQAYTDSYPEHPNYYVFDPTLLPERETEIVYGS